MNDWLATTDGRYLPLTLASPRKSSHHSYRLYRFLTDIEDILEQENDDHQRLQSLATCVRCLLTDADWLPLTVSSPDPETGWSVFTLYEEPDFPLTIQTVAWAPGSISPVHNHATWGIVALLRGKEKNTLWQRRSEPFADTVEVRSECLLASGDMMCFLPDAIHQIEAISTEPTISFNIYGVTDYTQRWQFDPHAGTAELF